MFLLEGINFIFQMRASWEVMGNSTIFAGGVGGKVILFPEWLPGRGSLGPPRSCPVEVSSIYLPRHSAHCMDHSVFLLQFEHKSSNVQGPSQSGANPDGW